MRIFLKFLILFKDFKYNYFEKKQKKTYNQLTQKAIFVLHFHSFIN